MKHRKLSDNGPRWLVLAMVLCGVFAAHPARAMDQTTYIVSIPGTDRAVLARVEEAGGVVDHVDRQGARVYIHNAHWASFQAAGIPFTLLKVQPAAEKQLAGYPSYDELGSILSDAAENHPDIVRLESLGQSIQGRELWAVRITDFPDEEEDEPEFAYISTIHGDEKVGTVLCLNFLDLLLNGYGSDGFITALIDDTELWLVPLMNPDGYEMNVRWNANGRDLNRSFPEFSRDFTGTIYTDGPPSTAGREPEVAHIMDWTAANSFVLGANYHTGALLVNYPYDEIPDVPSGTDAPTPDDDLMRDISLAYASLNPPMFDSPEFTNGISNGSAWFRISGGMQDWHYRYAGFVELTFEVSNIKTPNVSTLPGLWDDNQDAMFAYLALVHRGARGIVTDRITGAPLYAQVLVDDNPQPVFSDPDVGDYHRLLLPGTYTLRVEAPGYIPYTTPGVTVADAMSTRVDAPLSQGDVNRDGDVNAADLQIVINTILNISEAADADVDGGGVSATDVQHLVNRVLHR